MSYHGFRTEDEYLDARAEAIEETYLDRLDEVGWTCSNHECRHVWDPGHVPASRYQPSEVRRDCCPIDGCEPLTDDSGVALTRDEVPDDPA